MNKDKIFRPPQFGGSNSSLSPTQTHSPNDFLTWLETKHREELAKLRQLLLSQFHSQPQSVPFSPCLPQFGGRHSWNPFAVKLPQGKIFQCQFCFREKLIPVNPQQNHTQYYPPQTYYVR